MINNLRFELSFKSISQLEKKLNFCKNNKIKNINIPCKGIIKKDLFYSTIKYISKNYNEFNVTYHYSLYHQYSKNKAESYQYFLDFVKNSHINRNYEILLVSGSNKKKNFDSVDVLAYLKKEKNLKVNFRIWLTFIVYAKIMSKINFFIVNLLSDTFDDFVDDLLSSDVNLLKGELDFLIMQHLFNSTDLKGINKTEIEDNESLAA